MKRVLLAIFTIFLFTFGFAQSAGAEGVQSKDERPQVKLTDEQKAELGKIHEDLHVKKKELFNKYVEYGVFTEEQGKAMIEKLEERYSKLKENNYMMRWHHYHKMKERHLR